MGWGNINKLPDYNPFMFELARHSRGETKSYSGSAMKIKVMDITKIENGIRLPTEIEINKMCYWYDYPIGFFSQWYESRIDISGCLAKSIPIDYMNYPIFKELNPNFTTLDFILPSPIKVLGKIVNFNK